MGRIRGAGGWLVAVVWAGSRAAASAAKGCSQVVGMLHSVSVLRLTESGAVEEARSSGPQVYQLSVACFLKKQKES